MNAAVNSHTCTLGRHCIGLTVTLGTGLARRQRRGRADLNAHSVVTASTTWETGDRER
jgi:hypothetical protein